jgi:hypothetical protein
VNDEPADAEGTSALYAAVPACFLRLSGQTQASAAAVGVALTHSLALEARPAITERCRIRNVRTREGHAVPAQPDYYDVKYVNWGRRGHHLELALDFIL